MAMSRGQRKALKMRLRTGLKFHRNELKKWERIGSLHHMRRDRLFKAGFSNIKKELRLYRRLSSKI